MSRCKGSCRPSKVRQPEVSTIYLSSDLCSDFVICRHRHAAHEEIPYSPASSCMTARSVYKNRLTGRRWCTATLVQHTSSLNVVPVFMLPIEPDLQRCSEFFVISYVHRASSSQKTIDHVHNEGASSVKQACRHHATTVVPGWHPRR